MTSDSMLEPSRDKPLLPEDRKAAFDALNDLRLRSADAISMADSSGISWAHVLLRKPLDEDRAEAALSGMDIVIRAIKELERHLDIIHAKGEAPKTLNDIKVHIDRLIALTADHVSASISSQIADLPPAQISALVDNIKHLAHCDIRIRESLLDGTTPNEGIPFLTAAAVAATTLTDELGCSSLEITSEKIAALEQETPSLESRVRRLMVLSARLDLPDITLSEISKISEACAKTRDIPTDIRHRLGEAAPENELIIRTAAEKAAKIKNAAKLLDDKIGLQWRDEPLDKLSQAWRLSEIPGHPSHGRIGEYAASIGIRSHVRSHLDAIVKTRSGMASFQTDPGLKRMIPKTFNGLETRFDLVLRAIEARKSLTVDLGDIPGADRVLAALSSNLGSVADDFISFAELIPVVSRIDMPPGTRLDHVRNIHADRIGRLKSLLQEVQNMPVHNEMVSIGDALRLGRLAMDVIETQRRIQNDEAFILSGAHSPSDLLTAYEWHQQLKSMLPEESLPHGDQAFAQLHVHARAASASLLETESALAAIASVLPDEAMPSESDTLRDIASGIEAIKACEPVLLAQVLFSESLHSTLNSDLAPFIALVQKDGVPSKEWVSRLQEDYDLLDKLTAEDEAAENLLIAAAEAAPTKIIPLKMGEKPTSSDTADSDPTNIEWEISDIAVIPLVRRETIVNPEVNKISTLA